MSSKSIDLYSSQFESDYQSVSQLDRYDLNDSFIDDSQCSIDVNVVAINNTLLFLLNTLIIVGIIFYWDACVAPVTI